MSEEPFKIGDYVWRVSREHKETWIPCPDCGGTKTLKATLFDGTTYVIECAGCAAGYEPPRGVVRRAQYEPSASYCLIEGVRLNDGKYEYVVSGRYHVDHDRVFRTEEEALACAKSLIEEWEREENERVFKKEKDGRTWAWHVHYHRREMKEAQRLLEYHSKKLGIAKEKSKQAD